MAGLLGSLLGSQLVARFQRRCGLFPRGDEDQRAQAVGNGSRLLTPRDVRNGQRPGFGLPADCATCNGSPGGGWKVTRSTGAGCERGAGAQFAAPNLQTASSSCPRCILEPSRPVGTWGKCPLS